MPKKTKKSNLKVSKTHAIYFDQINELNKQIEQCENKEKLDKLKEDLATLKGEIQSLTGKNSLQVQKASLALEINWKNKATSFQPVTPHNKLTSGQKKYMPKIAIQNAKQEEKKNKKADVKQEISEQEHNEYNPLPTEFITSPPKWHEIAEMGSKIILSKEELTKFENPQELTQVSPKPVIEAREKQLDTFMGYLVTLNEKYQKFKQTRDELDSKIKSKKFSNKDKESCDLYSKACLAAFTLIHNLSGEHKKYVSDETIAITKFRGNCIEHIENASELQKHRGFLKPLAGLLESIASLIMSTGPGTFFDRKIKIKTNTEKKLDSLIKHLNELIEPTNSSESAQRNSDDSSLNNTPKT